jgi:transcription antitermination factor NusG
MTARWYCAQIRPELRSTAKFNLDRQNFESFCPDITIRGVRGKPYTQPMFHGYLFVKFDVEVDRWLSVNGTKGVVGLLPRYRERPLPMADGLVERLTEQNPLNEGDFVEVFTEFVPGLDVVIADSHYWLGGSKGVVMSVRTKILQIALSGPMGEKGVWLDREHVLPTGR